MALSKKVKARIALNKSRRKRWADKPTRDYEKAMNKWHLKYDHELEVFGQYSEDALYHEPVSPHTRWAKKHAGKGRFDTRVLERTHA